MCVDVNGVYTYNYNCTYINTSYAEYVGSTKAPYLFNNQSATRNGKAVLVNCMGMDTRNGKCVEGVHVCIGGLVTGGTITATMLETVVTET